MSKQAGAVSWFASGSLAVLAVAVAGGAARGEEPKCSCPISVEVRQAATPLLAKVPYVNRLFKSVGVGSNCSAEQCAANQCAAGDCRKGECFERLGVDFDVVAHEAECQAACKAKACQTACPPNQLTAVVSGGEKCVQCPCNAPVSAVVAHCTTAGQCAAGVCEAGKVCHTAPVAAQAPACCCKEGCSAAACAAGQCPAAARCAEQRGLPLPIVRFITPHAPAFPPIPGFAAPWAGPHVAWAPHASFDVPPIAEMHQALLDIATEKAALEAAIEVQAELSEAREEMFDTVAELLAEKAKAEAQVELFSKLLETRVENAKLQARVELQNERQKLTAEVANLIAENARLKAHQELAGQREELLREALHLTLENERLKRHVAELERHSGARTATKPHGEAR